MLAHVAPGFVSVQQMQEQGLLATEGSGNIRTTVYRTKSEKVSHNQSMEIYNTGDYGQLRPSDS